MTYYAVRKSVKNNTPATNERFGEKAAMERQFHLYCASAATNEAENELDAVEWGTIEGGTIERKFWNNAVEEVTE